MGITSDNRGTRYITWAYSLSLAPVLLATSWLFRHWMINVLESAFLADSPALSNKVFWTAPPAFFFIGQWIIWDRQIIWNLRKRIVFTGAALLLACLFLLEAYPLDNLYSEELAYSSTAWLLAVGFALTGITWARWTPPVKGASDGRVPCPKCGYDMRAQRECRCPECGHAFTLSDVVARQPSGELPRASSPTGGLK